MTESEATDSSPLTTVEAFCSLWTRVGCCGDARKWHERLHAAWHGPYRFYHNWRHLTECLMELDASRADFPAGNLPAVGMSLWFHDAIYNPQANDNEERSANEAALALAQGGASVAFIERVTSLILATKAHAITNDPDTALILDIDLSILGKSPGRFWEYEAQIRAEYAWAPLSIFSEKRAAILQGFLSRERLYMTPRFFEAYESQARKNLADAIKSLHGQALHSRSTHSA